MSRAALCVLFLGTAASLPVYTTPSNATLALVLCRGLDAAVSELRQRELDEHALGAAWLERDCVSVDPCEQTSSNENPYFRTVVPKYGPPLFKARHQQQAA